MTGFTPNLNSLNNIKAYLRLCVRDQLSINATLPTNGAWILSLNKLLTILMEHV